MIKRWFFINFLCRFGIHNWEICQWVSFKDKKCKQLIKSRKASRKKPLGSRRNTNEI